jgi:uncharacterized glyoxalase superfamily protein PhnB
MAVNPVPEGYHSVTPYLGVDGAAKLIDFLKTAFDAKELFRHSHPDGSVWHCEVKIGDSIIMIGEPRGVWIARPCTLYLYVADCDALYNRALKAGATSLVEPADQFYGDRSAGIQDPTGNFWWIATHKEDLSPEEIQKRAAAFGKK